MKKEDRKNLKNLPFITIDDSETKDIDDAVYVEKKSNGYTLYVAIADVSHFVKSGSKLDLDARQKTSTEYLLGATEHMFPDKLSQGDCSLFKKSDKLVAVCQIEFDNNGKRASYEFYKGIINSRDEVNYDRVNNLLRNKEDYNEYDNSYNLKELLKISSDLSFKIKKLREASQNNASSFGSEPKCELSDDNKRIIGIKRKSRDIAEKMIENFMISANLCAGDLIYRKTKNGIVRKHKALTTDNYDSIVEKAKNRYDIEISQGDIINDFAGYELSMQKNLRNILIEEYVHAEYTHDMKDNFHEGLTVKNYAHFTSPIRRYADVLAHRLIFNEIESLKDDFIEIKSEVKKADSDEVEVHIETKHITKYISDKQKEIKDREKKHKLKMLDAYYLEFCKGKTRTAKVLKNHFKTKEIVNKETGEKETKEFYAGSFLQFYEGDEVLVKLPRGLQVIDYKITLIFDKDIELSKRLKKPIYKWQLTRK